MVIMPRSEDILSSLVGLNADNNLNPIDFSEQLDRFIYGDMPSSEMLFLSKTPKDVGLYEISEDNGLPILLKQSVIRKIQAEHNIAASSLKQLPELLKNHPLSFESITEANSLVVVCDFKDSKGGDVVVALHLEKDKRSINVNEIASIYGKGNLPYLISNVVDLGKKVYTNKNTADWIRRTGVQFPERIANRLYDNYTTVSENKAKIIKNSEPVVTAVDDVQSAKTEKDVNLTMEESMPAIAGNRKVEHTTPQLNLPATLTLGKALGGKSSDYIEILEHLSDKDIANPIRGYDLSGDEFHVDPVTGDYFYSDEEYQTLKKGYLKDKAVIEYYNNCQSE